LLVISYWLLVSGLLKMQDYKKLMVWKKSYSLALAVYQTTALFPKEEIYGLTSQSRRASVSIPANIAEGCGREGNAELVRYLQIAQGSASELETHLMLAVDLKYCSKTTYETLQNQLIQIRKMLTSLIQKLKTSNKPAKTKD
jgi:four helix bundle protein